MTDYLALAMEQEKDEEKENIGNDIFYVTQTTQVKSGSPRIKNPPLPAPNQERDSTGLPPRLKMPRVGEDFRFSVSRDATRAMPYSTEEETGRRDPSDVQSDVAETGEGEPAAEPEWLHTAGVSRSAAVYDALLSGSGSGAGGAILTSLISRKQEGQKGFLGGSGGPFFGLSKNGPPGSFAPAMGQREQTAREEAVLPLLRQVRQAQRSSGFVQSQRRAFAVALPEGGSGPAMSAEDFDLACERDARRYGGGFGLY